MKDIVLNEIKKGLSWKESIVVALFGDLFYYTYKKGMTDCYKYYNK